ncbi:MAG TPA: tetratricopeptide repeat protein, partial [Ktedonobacterales bacterium]|nr:tetratricopeptide repeat protein [Ktedonobacterales bacterium]
PSQTDALTQKGMVLLNMERIQESVATCQRATTMDPQNAFAWASLAMALDGAERMQDALRAVERAVALDTNDPEIWAVRGAVLADAGKYSDALHALDRSLSMNPGNQAVVEARRDIANYRGARNRARAGRVSRGVLAVLWGGFVEFWKAVFKGLV